MNIKPNAKIVRKPDPTEADLQRQAVLRLAAQVKSEAHWEHILSSAETEAQREELERVVGPLLPFRRAAPCTTPDCETGKPGLWQPVLVVCSPIAPEDAAHVPIELHLCDECKATASVEDFLVDSIWSQIVAAWDDPTIPPVRQRTMLQWSRTH